MVGYGGGGWGEERAWLHQTSSQGFPQGSSQSCRNSSNSLRRKTEGAGEEMRVREKAADFCTPPPSPSLLSAHPRWQLTPISVTQLRQKNAAGVKGKKRGEWGSKKKRMKTNLPVCVRALATSGGWRWASAKTTTTGPEVSCRNVSGGSGGIYEERE